MAKKPGIEAAPKLTKTPAISVPDPDDVVKNEPVAWGLRFLDLGGKWGWRTLEPNHASELHDELVGIEGETLHNLLRRKKVKDIPAHHMTNEAQERLKQRGLEEADTLWELRLPHKWRAWGLVEGSTFYFLWWDPLETVCGHPPKRTRRR